MLQFCGKCILLLKIFNINIMNFKKLFLGITTLLLSVQYTIAQTPVELHISHKLGGITEYSTTNTATTGGGSNIQFSRMEYYISNISITHDGGMVTDVPDHYILANANQPVMDDLGSFNITNVESVSFYIGVDTPENHEDPSLLPATHPLAPKAPSMHWGWTDGYRFVAMEGMTGANMDLSVQLHSLGDAYYYQTTVTTSAVMKNGKLVIPVMADYVAAFNGIDISQGMIDHGTTANNIKFLENFRDNVFKPGFPVSVGNVTASENPVTIYPNPANGQATIYFSNAAEATILITDIQGRVISETLKAQGSIQQSITIDNPGMYFITVGTEGETVTKKLIVQ